MKYAWIMLVGLGIVGCVPSEEPETRPTGEPVLSPQEMQAAMRNADFKKHVKPILEAHCVACHNPTQASGGWDATRKLTFFASGAKGPRVVPGNQRAGLLPMVLSDRQHAMRMPVVGNAIPQAEVDVLKAWIAQGADWPDGSQLAW